MRLVRTMGSGSYAWCHSAANASMPARSRFSASTRAAKSHAWPRATNNLLG